MVSELERQGDEYWEGLRFVIVAVPGLTFLSLQPGLRERLNIGFVFFFFFFCFFVFFESSDRSDVEQLHNTQLQIQIWGPLI